MTKKDRDRDPQSRVKRYRCYRIQKPVLKWSQTNKNLGIWDRERLIAVRTFGLCPPNPKLCDVLGEIFIGLVWGEGCRLCVAFFWLLGDKVTGWCSRNLGLSLKLSSYTWVEGLLLTEEPKDIVMYVPSGRTRILL